MDPRNKHGVVKYHNCVLCTAQYSYGPMDSAKCVDCRGYACLEHGNLVPYITAEGYQCGLDWLCRGCEVRRKIVDGELALLESVIPK